MSVEFIGERIFLQETAAAGEVWVARSSHGSIYAVEIDQAGFSLPVWSTVERAAEFLRNALLVGPKYEPRAVPLPLFTTTWLSDRSMGIVELQINPDGRTKRVLVLTSEEFQARQPQA